MLDVVGYRSKVGVTVPSTNTVVEHDLNMIARESNLFDLDAKYADVVTDAEVLGHLGSLEA